MLDEGANSWMGMRASATTPWQAADERVWITVELNGASVSMETEPRRTLADALRAHGCTGTHLGCEHGVCGSCTVLLDGSPVRSCLVFAVQADGSRVETVEGLASGRS